MLRPLLEFRDPHESDEALRKKKVESTFGAIRDAIVTINNNKPFCSPDIYKALTDFTHLAHKELIQYRSGNPKDQKYWEDAEKNQKEILASTNNICEAIRTRVSTALETS
jgi:hypothetical protein